MVTYVTIFVYIGGDNMNGEQNILLHQMKRLVSENKRRFEERPDRDYIMDLLEIGITVADTWKHILSLNNNYYIYDSKDSYRTDGKTLIFIKRINGYDVYIKLRIEDDENGESMTICLSFHINQ